MTEKLSREELEQRAKALESKIIELQREKDALSEQLAVSKRILSSTPDLLAYKDPNSVYQSVNPAFCRFLDKEEEEIIGKTDFDLFPDAEATMYRHDDAKVMASGKSQVQNEEVTGAGGAKRWLQVTKHPVVDEVGKSIGILCSVRDITGLRKSEAAFKDSEDKLQIIFRAAPTGIGMVSNRLITQANERLCEILGYSEEELLGKSARILYPSDEDFEYAGEEKYKQIRDKGTGTVETRWQHKDGKVIDVLLSSTPLDLNDWSIGAIFTALDITDTKKTEQAIRESEERYRSLFKNNHSVMFLVDPVNADIVDVNPAATNFYGWSHEELTSMKITDINIIE